MTATVRGTSLPVAEMPCTRDTLANHDGAPAC
jgi:hypothetical protein